MPSRSSGACAATRPSFRSRPRISTSPAPRPPWRGFARRPTTRTHTTSGPLWAAATWIPVLGDDVGAARDVSASVAGILDTAQPLEAALPRLDPKRGKGRFDVAALADVARALPNLSTAVDKADATVAAIDPSGPAAAAGRRRPDPAQAARRRPGPARERGARVPDPPVDARPGPHEELAGAAAAGRRGARHRRPRRRVRRRQDEPRQDQRSPARPSGHSIARRKIPSTAVPQELNDLWGKDLTEWAGLNLSPHFPWTGQLVSAGWAAKKGSHVDYVAAIDQYAVGALLAGHRAGEDRARRHHEQERRRLPELRASTCAPATPGRRHHHRAARRGDVRPGGRGQGRPAVDGEGDRGAVRDSGTSWPGPRTPTSSGSSRPCRWAAHYPRRRARSPWRSSTTAAATSSTRT